MKKSTATLTSLLKKDKPVIKEAKFKNIEAVLDALLSKKITKEEAKKQIEKLTDPDVEKSPVRSNNYISTHCQY